MKKLKIYHINPLKLSFILLLGIIASALTPLVTFAQSNSEPIFGRQSLSSGFSPNPYILEGVSGGNAPVNTITRVESTPTGSCKGYMQRQPDYEVLLNNNFNSLTMEVRSEVDTTLVVTGSSGTWCNDDFDGQPNPRITGSWSQGLYKIWVGSYVQNSYHPYQLRISR